MTGNDNLTELYSILFSFYCLGWRYFARRRKTNWCSDFKNMESIPQNFAQLWCCVCCFCGVYFITGNLKILLCNAVMILFLIVIIAFMIHLCHSVIVWYNSCIITQYCVSSRGSVVERPISVRKVMGSTPIWSSDFFWVLCLRIYLYILFIIMIVLFVLLLLLLLLLLVVVVVVV